MRLAGPVSTVAQAAGTRPAAERRVGPIFGALMLVMLLATLDSTIVSLRPGPGVLRDWKPEEHAEVLQLIQRFARSLSRTPPAPAAAPV